MHQKYVRFGFFWGRFVSRAAVREGLTTDGPQRTSFFDFLHLPSGDCINPCDRAWTIDELQAKRNCPISTPTSTCCG